MKDPFKRGMLNREHFESTLAKDVAGHIIGEHIGSGIHRDVYAWELDPKVVCKLEGGAGSFANIREYDVWQEVKNTKFARWFAPVLAISSAGCLLLQARTTPVDIKRLPKKVPAFFTDLKASNWGRYKGRIVCHDYGLHMLLTKGLTNRMRDTNWSL